MICLLLGAAFSISKSKLKRKAEKYLMLCFWVRHSKCLINLIFGSLHGAIDETMNTSKKAYSHEQAFFYRISIITKKLLFGCRLLFKEQHH